MHGRPKNFGREEVLEKAMPVFWKHGFADTSLQELERATGVNKSGLYTEFRDKEDLFLACLRHYLESQQKRGLLTKEPLGWKNVETFLQHGPLNEGELKGCFSVNSMREFAILPDEAYAVVTENRALLQRLLAMNIEAEKPRMAPSAIAEMVLSFFSGLCIERNLNSGKTSTPRKIENFMTALRSLWLILPPKLSFSTGIYLDSAPASFHLDRKRASCRFESIVPKSAWGKRKPDLSLVGPRSTQRRF